MSKEPPFESTINLKGNENLQVVIRAHLISEQLLNAILTEHFPKVEVINLDRLNFLTKARLAVAMGLFAEYVLPAMTALNSLRNKFAHDLHYEFAAQDKLDLLNSLPSYVVDIILTDSDGDVIETRDSLPLERVLVLFVCLVESKRRDVVDSKKAEEAAFTRLRSVLDQGKRELEKDT